MNLVSLAGCGCESLNDEDRLLLGRAVQLGRLGWGRVHPNPMVGAVVARNGTIVAEAHHEVFGGPHAEVLALGSLKDARGATVYSSLEPCSHHGKTPPCTEALGRAGVARVVYWAGELGAAAGGGGGWLRRHGVQVDGPYGERADWAAENPFFFHESESRRPFVALKLAVSLDGRIAPRGGRRFWLTGPEARAEVHNLRAGFDAVLVGSRTWEADDPHLTARGDVEPRVAPVPVLLDRGGRADPGLRALRARGVPRGIVFTCRGEVPGLARRLGARADVVAVPMAPGGLDLEAALRALEERGIASVLCEGGGRLGSALLGLDLVDRLYLFLAPVLIGAGGVPAFASGSPGDPEAVTSRFRGWQSRLDPVKFGNDTLIVLDRGA